jgi:hypothetical protein
VDFHYGLIRRHVEIEKRVAKELMGEKKPFWKDLWDTREIFMGVNGVGGTLCGSALISSSAP